MTAIYSALRLVQQHYLSTLQQVGDTNTPAPSTATAKGLESTDVVVFGFPYLDTLKVSSQPHYTTDSLIHTCLYIININMRNMYIHAHYCTVLYHATFIYVCLHKYVVDIHTQCHIRTIFIYGYVTYIQIMQRKEFNPGGLYFFGHGDCSDLTLLEGVLKEQHQKHRKVIAVFTECPSNPLLLCPNFQRYVCSLEYYCIQSSIYIYI